MPKRILIDAREFRTDQLTGIGRVLEGLILALHECAFFDEIRLAVLDPNALPSQLKTLFNVKNVKIERLPLSFFKSEKRLTVLCSRDQTLFISPYPKLPLFGCLCPSVHMIHDVLDLTLPAYRKRLKSIFDKWRLKRSLRQAHLTWYVSNWSQKETMSLAGTIGQNPRVRHNGLSDFFHPSDANIDHILKKYGLPKGYILVLGNGLPHKNAGVLLSIAEQLARKLVFAGVNERNRQYWKTRFPASRSLWIEHIAEHDLPALIQGAFCLAQPSTLEGYGFPPLEAMACGIPAVVSHIPVLLETTGGNAFSAAPDHPQEWVDTFLMLEDQDRYHHQVKKGLEWVEPLRGTKGWQRHIEDLKELIGR